MKFIKKQIQYIKDAPSIRSYLKRTFRLIFNIKTKPTVTYYHDIDHEL